jgi:hypothetical protein
MTLRVRYQSSVEGKKQAPGGGEEWNAEKERAASWGEKVQSFSIEEKWYIHDVWLVKGEVVSIEM